MKASELRTKQPDELKSTLLDLHREAFSLRMQQATGQLGKSHQIKSVRRDIARVNMVLAEKGGKV
ncbi:50S ribosomal protein L29 [Methylococcus geothermalis]|uniref:Large ribosomal subunit protein uL29 n=1 Tax=Methylococcus geothermalis TaxID=2681310 RepID=A0A858QAY4_9GAMM|nr:50S ribosomal protein L29 [Methylococcus geothermalis]QJD31058.1 50S ribosomal protein L29 [Methylococcus geothermalis]